MLADGTQAALFVVEVLTVLAIPGPTNSLLFVSGVSRGFQASLKLIVAEVGAYLISHSVLISALKPVTSAYPAMPQLLRVACSIALVYVAVKLWQSGAPAAPAAHPITVHRVFLTTLMNPKVLGPTRPWNRFRGQVLRLLCRTRLCLLAGITVATGIPTVRMEEAVEWEPAVARASDGLWRQTVRGIRF